MKRITKIITSVFLIAICFFSIFSNIKSTNAGNGSNNGVSLLCDLESSFEDIDTGKYASISRGNQAYANILVEDQRNSNVTIYYHTVSGSAIGGVDYTEVSSGVVTSPYRGESTRIVAVAVKTQLSDLALVKKSAANDYISYLTRSFSIVIDRAIYDDGSELPIIDSQYTRNNKTYTTSKDLTVYLNAKNTLSYNGEKLSAYSNELTYSNSWGEVDYGEGKYGYAITASTGEMQKVVDLGIAKYYATATCWLGEPQDSDEELTRFCIGNDSWYKWGGSTYGTPGHGWFFGAHINAYRTEFGKASLVSLVEKNNDRSYWMSTGAIDVYDYVKYDDTYWFYNNEGPTVGYSIYRQWETDGEISLGINVREKIFDSTLPTVEDLYLDTNSLYATEGIYRLAVRFSEPVRNATGTKIYGETNLLDKTLEFNYAGGEGSDTLYFDCDTNQYESLSVKKITFNGNIASSSSAYANTGFIDFRNIKDYGGNSLDKIGLNSKTFDVTLDKRIPYVEVEQTSSSSDIPQTSPTVPINIMQFTSGNLYYEWVKEDDYESFLNGNELNSFAVVNKLKQDAINPSNSLASFQSLTNTSLDEAYKTQVTLNDKNTNGNYVLVLYAEPIFSINDEANLRLLKCGPYQIDNTKPTYSNLRDDIVNILDSGGFNRQFTFNVSDENGIDSVTALVKETKPNAIVNKMACSVSNEGLVNFTLDLESLINKFYLDGEGKPTINTEAGFFEINFEIKDKAGNITNVYSEYQRIYLSVQPYFDANVEMANDSPGEKIIENVYTKDLVMIGNAKDEDLALEPISVSINDSEFIGEVLFSEEYDVLFNTIDDKNTVYIQFKKPGYYKFKFKTAGSYSDTFDLYITEYFNEQTENYNKAYSNELLLVNKTIQLSENVQFLFINNNKQIEREFYGEAINPTFSSEQACLDFLKFYEYQDLKYEVLTTNTASYLNTGSGEGYNKAIGEERTAMSGQVWIRYKRTSWSVNSESINDWAYYFYKESDDGSNTINIQELSQNLSSAIDTVTKKICSKAGSNPNAYDLYLVDDEHLDEHSRAPYLNEKQIALSRAVTYELTKSGNNLLNASYPGDPNLFENRIRKTVFGQAQDLPIATNLKFNISEITKLYIASYSDEQPLSFVPLKAKEGMTLRDAINAISTTSSIVCSSGVYVIREVDINGGCEFCVYVDADAPRLGIMLNGSSTIEYIDSREVANLFASKLVLASVGDGKEGGVVSYSEIDKSAYVALFTLPGQKLYSIYYRGDIPQENLPEGSYLVHVGDRSGNFYSFKIFVSESTPKFEFKPYDNKIVIKISNRTADELKSVEIYCNDVLISTSLNPEQEFTQNGTYRIVVKDKYSNNEYTETKEFTRLPPQVQFKYENNGFDPYNEGNTSYMIIRNDDGYQLVSTSRRLQIILQSEDAEFEIKGLQPGDYSYNEATGIIEMNSLLPFYIDIWNAKATEDIISYKIVIDNTAPIISVVTDNPNITFDESDSSKYPVGNSENPTSIRYNSATGVSEQDVYQEQKIFNDYVNVNVKDDTAVKEVRVYQNGDLVKTYSAENDDKFNFYIGNIKGKVKIVAVDLFNTSTSFEFDFVDKKISDASIDDNQIASRLDGTYYGNKYAYIECYEDSEVHLMFNYNNTQVNQIYKYLDGKLYIGKYTVNNNKYGIVDFYNGGIEVINELGEKIYYDKPVTLDVNNTYKPFEDYELYIICDPATGKIIVKLEASETANKLVARINKGKTLADYYEIELSKEEAKLDFTSDKELIISENYIYSSSDEVNVTYDTTKISNIVVAYNRISNYYSENDFIYTLNNMFENGEGYYCIKATNVYGITTEYYLIYSKTINASIELFYADKASEVYSIDYADNFYTNTKAVIVGYKLSKLEGITSDGSTIYSSKFGEEYTLIIDKTSTVTIEDVYGNKKTINIFISSDPTFKYNDEDSWIVGFDSLVDPVLGYSNKKLSINLTKEEIERLAISQIRVINDDNIITLYGYDGLSFVDYDSDKLDSCIGLEGSNVYKVMFANLYGDIAIKEIHYSEESTLIIKRQTSSSVTQEDISINEALNNGVWSNREILLSSLLDNNNLYKFYIKADGENDYRELALPYTLQLASTSQNGTLKYFIKYKDAYGYSHELSCILNRQDIQYQTVNMNFITISQVQYTKDPIVIKFDSNCTATYVLDSSVAQTYNSEQVLYNDGAYIFTIKDYSGNVTTIDFVKDSICKFNITNPDGTIKAYSGGVINTNQLIFNNLGDSSYIKHAKYNGELIKVVENMSFNKTGLYELIIEDAVSNTSYFSFYLINHSINEFNYTVPTSYIIQEVYRTYNDLRTPFMDAVNTNKTQLNLSLEGKYDVILKNIYQDSTINFEIEINKDEPKASLVGCDNGEVTTQDISIKDVGMDDIVEVYRNGELVARYDSENQEAFKTIDEGGEYEIRITNIQGVTKTLTFTKKNIANTSLSILIIILCILVAGGFFIGLLFRNRSKFDD